MVLISDEAMCMSRYNRTKQKLKWYTDGINLCTQIRDIADKIEAECKRRKIDYTSVLARELLADKDYTSFDLAMVDYNIYKICISGSLESLEAYDKKVQKLHAPYCVPALKKKQLADWAVTTFNCDGEIEEPMILDRYSTAYNVWIQPSSDVQYPLSHSRTIEELEEEVETHWVEFR